MATHPKTLVLVPTEYERKILLSHVDQSTAAHAFQTELCGFGPIVAAARTSQLVGIHRPDRVLLVGIAGSYDDTVTVNDAFVFSHAACFGIGAGSGEQFESSTKMGWSQWPGDENNSNAINDIVELVVPDTFENANRGGLLLTVTAAAKNETDCTQRRMHFPDATCEDMEAFGVASACRLHNVPTTVIRGISNRAGDRDKANWAVAPALLAAAKLTTQFLAE